MTSFTIEDDVKNYLLAYGDAEEDDRVSRFFEATLSNETIVSEVSDLKDLLSVYRETFYQISDIIKEWSEDDILFIPFHTPSGSTFFTSDILSNHDDDELASFLANKGGVHIIYNLAHCHLNFIHANYGWMNCFQYRGKYDYAGISSKLENLGDRPSDIRITGNFSANFLTADDEEVYIDEIIHQQYCGGEIDEGWEDEMSPNGIFQADSEASDDYIGDEAIRSHYSIFKDDFDVKVPTTWLDANFVSEHVGS